ncbi:MAG: O-antigen ligase family protein [Verrucomicrobia bacterium]|nr:O-antigen ligase family protein [Verrucomicrobiota bacterium]
MLWLSLAVAQALIGGTRMLFSLPAYAILGLAGVLAVTAAWRPTTGKTSPDYWCVGAAMLFASLVALRAWCSPVAYLARPDLLSAAATLLMYLLSATLVTPPRTRLWLVGGVLALALAQLAVGAVQFRRGDDFMLFRWSGSLLDFVRSEDYRGRASGFYICPNHLAGNLEIVGSLTLAVACWSRLPVWVKLLLGYCGIACFAGLLLTGSRGGFLSSAAALTVLGLLSLWRLRSVASQRFGRLTLLIGLVFVVLAGGCLLLVKKSEALQRRAETLSSAPQTDVRPLLWVAAWKQFRSAPWLGTGSGTSLYYSRLLRDPGVQREPVHAHCDYLELLGEYGLAGAAALALFLAAHLRAGWRDFSRLRATAGWHGDGRDTEFACSNVTALNLGALTALTSLLAHSVVDFNLHIPANSLLLAWVCGFVANPGRNLTSHANAGGLTETPHGWSLSRIWPAAALPCLGAALLLAAWRWLPGEFYAEKARVALRDQRFLQAGNQALDGLEVEGENPDLYYYLGDSRLRQGLRLREPVSAESFLVGATEAFEDGCALFPQDTRLALRLGATLDELGRYDEAEAALGEALRWDPNSGRAWTYYANHLQRQGRVVEARSAYERALALSHEPLAQAGLEQLGTSGGELRPSR